MDPATMMKMAQMLGKKEDQEWQPIGGPRYGQIPSLNPESYEDNSYLDFDTQGDQAADTERLQAGINLVKQMKGSGGILGELSDPSFMSTDIPDINILGTAGQNVV
tara:strand:+ start:993 stop:1310 length:318 start_codon:yes stop_codon:yes gene_type:complete